MANSLVIGKFKGLTWHITLHTWCFYTISLHPWWLIPIKEKCNKKDVVQIEVEDKGAITCVVSCIANGNLICFQVVKQIGHCQEALKQKGLWIIMALPWFCLTIIVQTYIHVKNLSKWIWFVNFNYNNNDWIYHPKDGVVQWLLECPLFISISGLDERKVP